MKRLLTAIFAIALIGVVFTSCKKDDETVLDNSITIEGTFTVGDKTYTNPTFDLGAVTDHEGYRRPNYSKNVEPTYYIKINPVDDVVNLGEGMVLEYDYYIYSDAVGTETDSEVSLSVMDAMDNGFWLYSYNVTTTVTTVDAVGGFIKGTFEGTLYIDKKAETTYPVKGKFKVKRTADDIPQ